MSTCGVCRLVFMTVNGSRLASTSRYGASSRHARRHAHMGSVFARVLRTHAMTRSTASAEWSVVSIEVMLSPPFFSAPSNLTPIS